MPRTTDTVRIKVDGREVAAKAGVTVAAALLQAGITCLRRSVTGEARGPLCGMGVCMECRVTVDGAAHTLACQTVVAEGMAVSTDA